MAGSNNGGLPSLTKKFLNLILTESCRNGTSYLVSVVSCFRDNAASESGLGYHCIEVTCRELVGPTAKMINEVARLYRLVFVKVLLLQSEELVSIYYTDFVYPEDRQTEF